MIMKKQAVPVNFQNTIPGRDKSAWVCELISTGFAWHL